MTIAGKAGQSRLQPSVIGALEEAGFTADKEDTRQFLHARVPVWRSKVDHAVVPTPGRRKIDIVVYTKSDRLVALVETESDLGDLREHGVSSRNGRYDVASIARNSDGHHFDSYNSLERMATAAFYFSVFVATKHWPAPAEGTALLETIRSDAPSVHNPANVAMFLVSGRCRTMDKLILQRRLKSLNAELLCAEDA
jgi:hypothetical protein